ncbi:unnamed protein product [Thelazia callipaeda]|uniref:Uncharacterized protein n=1 Tax=Thelazia callipaeda TaxID=103827 RepID=A0A0N5D315_THECL|nr:unnamed protein product [Thelazia callipaeda]
MNSDWLFVIRAHKGSIEFAVACGSCPKIQEVFFFRMGMPKAKLQQRRKEGIYLPACLPPTYVPANLPNLPTYSPIYLPNLSTVHSFT